MLTQPIRDEHAELLPQAETLRTAADSVGDRPRDELLARVADAERFLITKLIPHAVAEDRALYPVIDQLMGAPEATHTMSLDHTEVRRLSDLLGQLYAELGSRPLTGQDQDELRMILYGLYVLVRHHFEKEEEAYLPLLDRGLTPERANAIFAEMEAAAERAREAATPPVTSPS